MPEHNAPAERILNRLHSLAGAESPQGVERVVFTEGHLRAREQLIEWADEAALEPAVDPIGNLWLLPSEPAPRMLLMGSHLDSVPQGGKFDGALGVLLALEVASTATGKGVPHGKIAVVDFIAEESSRFGVGTVGSSVFAGRRSLDDGLALTDASGKSFGECRNGHWSGLAGEPPPKESFAHYLETHIDQATDLLDKGAPLGIVGAIAAPTRWRLVVVGKQAHAGAASMEARRDALVAAAELIVRIELLAREFNDGEVRATVGQINVRPNVPNVVPGRVELIVDLRVLMASQTKLFRNLLGEEMQAAARARGLSFDCVELLGDQPVLMDESIGGALSSASQELGIAAPAVSSWSAHDALHIAQVLPSGMILVRNRGGVSHNREEEVSLDDLTAAYALVEHVAGRLCDS